MDYCCGLAWVVVGVVVGVSIQNARTHLMNPDWIINDSLYSDGSEAFAIVMQCPQGVSATTWACNNKKHLLDEWLLEDERMANQQEKQKLLASAASKMDVPHGANTVSMGMLVTFYNEVLQAAEPLFLGGFILDVPSFDDAKVWAEEFNTLYRDRLDGLRAFPLRLGNGPVLHARFPYGLLGQTGVSNWYQISINDPGRLLDVVQEQYSKQKGRSYHWKSDDKFVHAQVWVNTLHKGPPRKLQDNSMELFFFFDSSHSPHRTLWDDVKRGEREESEIHRYTGEAEQ